MKNLEIAEAFRDIALILEIKGENVFRIRAYERAAQNIEALTQDIEIYISQDRLSEIPGIGKDLAEKIKEFSQTGKIQAYEELKKSIPEGLLEVLKIPSVGPKTAKLLYEKLGIKSVADLEEAIKANRLEDIFGIKEKTVENMVSGIAILKRGRERMTLGQALQLGETFLQALKKLPEVKHIACAGSLRRRKETVRDIDILVTAHQAQKVIDAFTGLEAVKQIVAKGETKASIRTSDDTQVDCRVVEDRSFGAALVYFTGSKNFNIKIRQLAMKKGLKINEYGVFRDDKFICGQSEAEVLKALGLPYIEPELREDSGEIELALAGQLPQLVELADIQADLHVHSSWSDGENSISEMAEACQKQGYGYCAITDHSQSLKIARGLSLADLKKKRAEIDRLNKGFKGFRILFGAEVDIDAQGGLDYNHETLKEFDLVVAAIHTGFKQSRKQITARIVAACKNKYVHIIAHPTGRLWGMREAYAVDLETVFQAAADTNTALEINSFPNRLDLNDLNCRRAKEIGAAIVINTDAHTYRQLTSMELGVSVARRGWLEKKDVRNTLGAAEFLKAAGK